MRTRTHVLTSFVVLALMLIAARRADARTVVEVGPGNALRWAQVRTVSDASEYTIFGLIRNRGDKPVELVHLTATLFSKRGGVLTTGGQFACLPQIPPGGASPFIMSFFSPPAGVDHHELSGDGFLTDDWAKGLAITNRTVRYQSSDRSFHVAGFLKNRSSRPLYMTEVCGATFNAKGRLLGVAVAYPEPWSLKPGGRGAFDLSVRADSRPARYTLWAGGELTCDPFCGRLRGETERAEAPVSFSVNRWAQSPGRFRPNGRRRAVRGPLRQ